MMKVIINYKRGDAVAILKSDIYVLTNQGQKKTRKTTIGWKLLVKWTDGSESWIPLKDTKESHSFNITKFSKVRNISDNITFALWVPYTLRKRDIILSKVKARICKTTHKQGI